MKAAMMMVDLRHTEQSRSPYMPRKIRQVLWWLLAGFLIYAIVTSPNQAADILASVWDIIEQGFRNIGRFFEALID